jgi:hypothetical protein
MCASHILENVMEEITAANRGSSSRPKKQYQTAATLISNQHQREKKNELLTTALTSFPIAAADEKNTPKNIQAKTQTDLSPSDPLPKNTDLASPREVEEENVLHAGRCHSLLSSPSTSRRCRLARPLSRPLR